MSKLNALLPQYYDIFTPKYAELYDQHVAGKILAHQRTVEENRKDPVIVGFGGEPGPEIGKIRDIKIKVSGPPAEEITLRIYEPKDLKEGEKRPCYLNFHGGGWVIGAIGDDEAFIRHVVKKTGAVAIDVGYRLAPEYRYPIPVEDSWEAFLYVRANPDEFSIDLSKFAIGGFSAGGHLSAVISHRARDQKFEPQISIALLIIPVCDASALGTDYEVAPDCPYKSWTEHHDGPFLSHARMSYFYKYFLPETFTTEYLKTPSLSPIYFPSFSNLPPSLVVPAEVDVLRDEGLAYAKKLRDEGDGWVELWLAKGVPHPFPHQYAATDVAVQFRELAIKRMNEAFAGELKGKKEFISNVEI